MGEEASSRLVDKLAQSISSSDENFVEAFVRSPIVTSIVGNLLYDSLFEFVQRSNLVGQIVRGLPVIGAIQMQVESTIKSFVDRQLGSVIKQFLGEYASTATERLLTLADTPQNRRSFADFANRMLAKEVLGRPTCMLVPDQATAAMLRVSAASLFETSFEPSRALVDSVYDSLGDRHLGDLLTGGADHWSQPRLLTALSSAAAGDAPTPPTALLIDIGSSASPAASAVGPEMSKALMGAWERFVTSSDGQEALVAAVAAALGTPFPTDAAEAHGRSSG